MYKLLVVDDEKMIRMGIKNGIQWKDLGIEEVFTASSAREALEIIEKEQPQIMLTDISMTEMSGLDLIAHIRQQGKNEDMRILVLTGYDRFDYARKCLQMKVQNFLLKPIDEEELKENVKAQIEKLDELQRKKELEFKKIRAEGSRAQMHMERFMRKLIQRRHEEEIPWPQELEEDKNEPVEAAILLPDIYVHMPDEEKDFRRLMIKNICIDLVDSRRAGITFTDDADRLVVIFKTASSEQSVTERIEELLAILEDEYGIKPRVVLGSEVSSLTQVFISYNDALLLLKQEQKGYEEILRTSGDKQRENIIKDVYHEFKTAMCENIANGDKVMHLYEEFKQATISYNLSRRQVQGWCFDLVAGLFYAYITMTGETPSHQLETHMKAIMGVSREEVHELTAAFIKRLTYQEKKEQNDIIILARRYIDEHLEGELSVTKLSEMFYVSPNYFSRLFKKVVGEGCNEYLVRKRIEKSKYFLETTTMKTGKIAMMVGYHDTNYFSLAFKKHTGMSPTKYRESVQKTG